MQVGRNHYREESTNLLGKTGNTAGCGPQREKVGRGRDSVSVREERIDG